MFKNSKKLFYSIVIIAVYLVGYFTNWFINDLNFSKDRVSQVREDSSEYKYINPLLFVANSEIDYPELDPLKKRLNKYIDQSINDKKAENISVYFRLMDTGKWTGVYEDKRYSPASMLKVVTLMAILKKASNSGNNILNVKKYYNYQEDGVQYYKPTPLKNGYYDILTLLQQMIIHSDNTAMNLVDEDNIGEIIQLYGDLKIDSPIGSPKDFMTPREYSRFFRTLYNSTYLPREYSEQTLNLLTHTSFDNGLRAGVPPEILISHKFGEQTFVESGKIESRELHDCGIVYHPREPYLLCVMTQGQDFSQLESVIGGISKIVFEYY